MVRERAAEAPTRARAVPRHAELTATEPRIAPRYLAARTAAMMAGNTVWRSPMTA